MTPVALPGFHDHHLHVLSAGAARVSVDISGARRLEEVVTALRSAAASRPAGTWIRAWGYDDAFLVEDRDPVLTDLDRASTDHPIVLRHRAGHVAVVNTPAAEHLRTVAGPGAVGIDGVLLDGHRALAAVPRLGAAALDRGVAQLSAELASHGITAVTDATVTNDLDALSRLASLVASGHLRQRVQAMAGAEHVAELAAQGIRYGSVVVHGDREVGLDDARAGARGRPVAEPGRAAQRAIGGVRVVHAKIELGAEDDHAERLALVRRCVAAGWPVALHVTDLVEADLALDLLEAVPPPPGTRHRVEHLALSLPEHVERLARCGAVVVSNPGFLTARAAKYRARLSADERGWLYRIGSLVAAGVPVRAGSDAPVTAPDVLGAIRAAVDRGAVARAGVRDAGEAGGAAALASRERSALGVDERVGLRRALSLFLPAPAVAGPGDVVVLSDDPRRVEAVEVLETRVGGESIFCNANPRRAAA